MTFLKWFLTIFLDWAAGKLAAFYARMKKKKELEDAAMKENKDAVNELEKAQTEDDRRNANGDVTKRSF